MPPTRGYCCLKHQKSAEMLASFFVQNHILHRSLIEDLGVEESSACMWYLETGIDILFYKYKNNWIIKNKADPRKIIDKKLNWTNSLISLPEYGLLYLRR